MGYSMLNPAVAARSSAPQQMAGCRVHKEQKIPDEGVAVLSDAGIHNIYMLYK